MRNCSGVGRGIASTIGRAFTIEGRAIAEALTRAGGECGVAWTGHSVIWMGIVLLIRPGVVENRFF